MAYICHVCGASIPTVKGLGVHLQIIHGCTALTTFTCSQGNCNREYSSLRSFKKHLRKQHGNNRVELEADQAEGNDLDELPHQPVHEGVEGNPNNAEQHDENFIVNELTLHHFQDILQKSAMGLAAKLYAFPTFNRTQVQTMIDFVSEFSGGEHLEALKIKTLSMLRECNAGEEKVQELTQLFEAIPNMFQGMETEYQRIKLFDINNCYISPIEYGISDGEKYKLVNGNRVLAQVDLTGQYIPMKQVLKQYLELPGVFESIVGNINKLKASDKFSNFVQGSLWKHIEETHYENKMVFPLHLYYDDVEPDSDTGSHSGNHKIGAVYYQIPCIPQHLISSLKHSFLSAVFLSSDRCRDNGAAFAPVIDQLLDFETNGIEIHTEAGDRTVYFALGLVLGDNLAQQSVLGLVESFSANYYCRFCKEHRATMQAQLRENALMLRNRLNYEADLQLENFSLTGIKHVCIWHRLHFYHVTENLIADIMHDLFEGVCHYVLCAILLYLIRDMQFLTIELLNERIQCYDFCKFGGKRPTFIRMEHIQNEKLRMTASEMMCFFSHLGLLIGDLVPENDEAWGLFIILSQIIDILRAPFVRRDECQYLATLIAEHHGLYCRLFNKTLKPKFHFMVHYPKLLLAIGPLIHVWSMRMEGKHRPVIKLVAANMTCRINLPLSIAIRYSFSLCSTFLEKQGFPKEVAYHPKEIRISECENFEDFRNVLQPDHEQSTVVHQANICGTTYSQNMVVAFNYEDNFPLFGKIQWIIKNDDVNTRPFFLLSAFYTVGYFEHFHAYKVQPSPEWVRIKQSDLVSFYTTATSIGADGFTYVVYPHAL